MSNRTAVGPRAVFSRRHAVTRVSVRDTDSETVLTDTYTFGTTWQALVWDRWPGGNMPRLAMLLTEISQQLDLTVELDGHAVRRLLLAAHLRPVGLRQLLARLIQAHLVIVVRPGDGDHWGTFVLAIPGQFSRARAPQAPSLGYRPIRSRPLPPT